MNQRRRPTGKQKNMKKQLKRGKTKCKKKSKRGELTSELSRSNELSEENKQTKRASTVATVRVKKLQLEYLLFFTGKLSIYLSSILEV